MDNFEMLKIAKLYYELDKNQKEIAAMENISRSKVSRMLTRAKDKGLIEIKVKTPLSSAYELEQKISKEFSLKKVVIVPVIIDNQSVLLNDVGKATGNFLVEILNNNDIIGISWGTTMNHVANNLSDNNIKNLKVVQLNGGMSHTKFSTTANRIVRKFTKSFDGEPYLMPVPAIVDNKKIADTLLTDSKINSIFSLCKSARVALFGIGCPSRESVLYKAGYFKDDNSFQRLLDQGAVGDICSRYFDIKGNICDKTLNERTIGMSLNDLKSAEYSVGVAIGKEKVKPIIGALNGGYINTLITDENTAQKVLECS